MANIAALQEDWGGASPPTAISTANSIVDNLSGAGTSQFSAAFTYNGHNGAQFVCAAASRIARCDHTGAGGWRSFPFAFDAAPSASVAVAVVEQTGVKASDLRLITDRTLQLRDAGSVARWTSTTVLAAGTVYWIAMKVDAAANGGHRVKIYNGTTGALIEDSGAQTNAGFTQTAPDTFKIGPQASVTLTAWYGQVRGDTTTEPSPPVTGGGDIGTITQTASRVVDCTGATGTVVASQIAGPTAGVTVTESPTGVFTIEHPVDLPTKLTFQFTAGGVSSDTVDIPRTRGTGIYVSDAGNWT